MGLRIPLSVGFVVSAVLLGVFGLTEMASAQGSVESLRVTEAVLTEVGEEKSVVMYEALVTVENVGVEDFAGAQRVDLMIDGGDRVLVYVVSGLAAGGEKRFKFRFELAPGGRTVRLLIGDVAHETSVNVEAADLVVRVNAHHVVGGGFVEFDVGVENAGGRRAQMVELRGTWQRVEDGEVGEVDFGLFAEEIGVGGSAVKLVSFEVDPGTYSFVLTVATISTEVMLENNAVGLERAVEFVEFDVVVESYDVVRWHAEGRGLVSVMMGITNVGVNDSAQFLVGIECEEGLCSNSDFGTPIAVGDTASVVLEVWVPVGSARAMVYAGANEDGFWWGDGNVVGTVFEVAEAPPLEWSLSAVSDAEEFRYWSDGSANAVFETTMVNVGSDLVVGELQILVSCSQSGEVVVDCGGDLSVSLDPSIEPNVTQHVVRVPKGETMLHFSHGEDIELTAEAMVPERILGVDREIWDCFSDRSNVRRGTSRDLGVGCGGWRNEFVTKWEIGKPILVWTEGDPEYVAIFDEVLEYVAPLLNVEFERVANKSRAELRAYLGLSRSERISGLRCNLAAGCTSFDVGADGTILSGDLVVWPPLSTYTESGRNHMIYSIALHELIHALTGMLHRHADRTSLMGYDSLDYTTLGRTDAALLRITSHTLVKPGMRFNEVGELIVFADEMLDRVEEAEITTAEVLRRAHATMMDAGSASYQISGGWPECDILFDDAQYSLGGFRPRASRWVHFNDDKIDMFLVRSQSRLQLIEYWALIEGQWRPILGTASLRVLGFRDSFSSPLTMLSSIVLYGDDAELMVISEDDGVVSIKVSLEGADVRTGWSHNTQLGVQLQVDTRDYTIPSYQLEWSFESEDSNVCDSYRLEASEGEYGLGFEFPDAIREGSGVLRLSGGR